MELSTRYLTIKSYKAVFLATTLLFFTTVIHAQLQNTNWCFGQNAGLKFTGSTISGYSSSIVSYESAATLSNRHTGDLMFYADSWRVWNANHVLMPNGKYTGSDTISTTAQGAHIVPSLTDTNKYYLFTLSDLSKTGTLYYSIVDMSLNGGLGDVIPSQKAIVIDSVMTEAMASTAVCNKVWLATLKRTNEFNLYAITKAGLNLTPVISPAGYQYSSSAISTLKFSPDGTKIAIATYDGNELVSYVAIHDFDNQTGKVTNGRLIDTTAGVSYYGCEFSPDGNRLYIGGYPKHEVYQFDLTQPTTTAITASKKLLIKDTFNTLAAIQMGPDSNIYVAKYGTKKLDRISNADALYPACVYTRDAVTLDYGNVRLGLPQRVVYPLGYSQDPFTSMTDTTLCITEPITLSAPAGFTDYKWSNNSNNTSISTNAPGTYWVSYKQGCDEYTDSFTITEPEVTVSINNDTVICTGDTITLTANASQPGSKYLWNTGATTNTTRTSEAGNYSVQVSYLNCTATDDMNLSYLPVNDIELGADSQLCDGDVLQLPRYATVAEGSQYLWSNGSTDSIYNVTTAGWHYVTVTDVCATITDSIYFSLRNCHLFFPDVFSPNGDGVNDIAKLLGDVNGVTDYDLSIFNRWGEKLFTTQDVQSGWNGNAKGIPADISTYYYLIRFNYLGETQLLKGSLMLVR